MKKLTFVFMTCLFVIGRAFGNVMCIGSDDGSTYRGTDGNLYVCYADANQQQMLYPTNGNHDYICLQYEFISDMTFDPSFKVLNHCTTTNSYYACKYNSYYTSSGCVSCPSGTVATAGTNGHRNTSCNVCNKGYYKSGSNCVPCPNGGYSGVYNAAITDCYVSIYDNFSDTSGQYSFTDTCYYSY